MQKVINEREEPGAKAGFAAADSRGYRSADLLVLIQGSRGQELYGSVAHEALQAPVPYGNIRELLLILDAIGRELGLSPSQEGFRTLNGKEDSGLGSAKPDWRTVDGEDEENRFWSQIYAQRPREFFQLRLMGMQNNSLQGSVRGRLTEGRYVYFRSALELMSMLSAVRFPQKEDRLMARN